MGRKILAVALVLLAVLPLLAAGDDLLFRIQNGAPSAVLIGSLKLEGFAVHAPMLIAATLGGVCLMGAWLLWRGPERER